MVDRILLIVLMFLSCFTNVYAMIEDTDGNESKTTSQQMVSEERDEPTQAKAFGARYNKIQIQQNPPLWLHVRVDKHSLYSAYANAWVTLGSNENARKYGVESISLTLRFGSTSEKTENDSAAVDVSQRTHEKCYNSVSAIARTTGPRGSISASTS